MSYPQPLIERERALEDAFFRRLDAQRIDALRVRRVHDEDFEALAARLGLHDAGIIEPLLVLGVRPENAAGLVMAPLVAVAWADRTLDNEERRQLLDDEAELGIAADSPAGRLLEAWLEKGPRPELMDAWAAYVTELVRGLPRRERLRLRDEILTRATRLCRVLEKTFLRGGGAHRAEQAILDRIQAAFDGSDGRPARNRLGGGLNAFVNALT
ncbi:MAG: hypothetical protein AAGC67_09740 [Myxococcota bacterium]